MDKMEPMFRLKRGKRYRLHMLNATDDVHPVHLHRHNFELTNVAGMPLSGLTKDVAMIGAFQELSVDFTADQPGSACFIATCSITWISALWRCSSAADRDR